MGLFDRFRRLVKSNINDMISKAENPEKVLNQLIEDMNRQLIDSKKSVASAIADEKKLEKRIEDTRAQADEWERKAILAVRADKDDLARQALERKQSLEELAEEQQKQWQAQHEAVERLKLSLRGLQQKLEEAQRKKNLLVARSKRVEAQRKLNETLGGLSDTSAFEAFDKMSERMDHMEAENEALEELNAGTSTSADALEREFAKLEKPAGDSDRMLEELRKKIALEDTRSAQPSAAGDSDGRTSGHAGGSSGTADVDETLEALKRRVKAETPD